MAIGEYIHEIGTYNTLLPFLFFSFRKLLFCYSPVTIHKGYSHGRADIGNFSSSAEKYFSTREEKFRISDRPCNVLFNI